MTEQGSSGYMFGHCATCNRFKGGHALVSEGACELVVVRQWGWHSRHWGWHSRHRRAAICRPCLHNRPPRRLRCRIPAFVEKIGSRDWPNLDLLRFRLFSQRVHVQSEPGVGLRHALLSRPVGHTQPTNASLSSRAHCLSSTLHRFHQRNHFSCSDSMALPDQRDDGPSLNSSVAGRYLGALRAGFLPHRCPPLISYGRHLAEQYNAKISNAVSMLRQCSPGLRCLLLEVFGYVVSTLRGGDQGRCD